MAYLVPQEQALSTVGEFHARRTIYRLVAILAMGDA